MKDALKSLLRRMNLKVCRIAPDRLRGVDLANDLKVLVDHKESPTILDAGAHVGQTSLWFLQTFQRANIFAFEPTPITYKELTKNLHGKNVVCENCALGEKASSMELNVFDGVCPMNSLLEIDRSEQNRFNKQQPVSKVTVPVRTLDEYCVAKNIRSVDILKIDTQGFDLNVLKGGRTLLAGQGIRAVVLEVNFIPQYQSQPSFFEIDQFLQSFNYRLVGFYDEHYFKNKLGWCDVCYVCDGQPDKKP